MHLLAVADLCSGLLHPEQKRSGLGLDEVSKSCEDKSMRILGPRRTERFTSADEAYHEERRTVDRRAVTRDGNRDRRLIERIRALDPSLLVCGPDCVHFKRHGTPEHAENVVRLLRAHANTTSTSP